MKTLHRLRIYPGDEELAAAYPDCVMVFKHDEFHCSGVAIAPQVVVTAAHCVKGFNHTELQVKAGKSKVHIEGVFQVVNSIPHPKYRKLQNSSHWNDIALLFLSRDITVTPRPVASRSGFVQASSGIMVGYGSNEPNSGNGKGVRRASRNVAFEAFLRRDDNGQILRADRNESVEVILSPKYTVEESDSGGGLYLGEPTAPRSIAGVASRKVSAAEQGIATKGSVYVWLDEYRPFILRQCDAQDVARPRFVS